MTETIVMECYTEDKAYLKGTSDRYDAVSVGGDVFLVGSRSESEDGGAEWSSDVYMISEQQGSDLGDQEVSAERITKRSDLLRVAEEMSGDFERNKDQVVDSLNMTRGLVD
jgi:hypothetical protein